MKSDCKISEIIKLNFCLSRCLIYDVTILKNKIEFNVGQVQFTEENDFWKIIFSIAEIDRDIINTHFDIKKGDSGFFSIEKRTANSIAIKMNVANKLLAFFSDADFTILERNYNF